MKFLFEVTETLSRTVEIEADSAAEAYQKGRAKYKNCEIVLDETDFVDVDFKTFENPEPQQDADI
ncbi:MAG: DpnD/PcfM family protein [Thermoguttaceae bacterium]|nr:DpnD/PcfM family protein [Thermoguttaceae bacterium]